MYHPNLKTFIIVADCGSFSKASEELYISKVSVMNQIDSLERHFGFPLFDRSNQGVTLTSAGQFIYQSAKNMIQNSENIIRQAMKLTSKKDTTIRIGTSVLRPCKRLINLWNNSISNTDLFQFKIVPFDDNPTNMKSIMDHFGEEIDCFVSPCDSVTWRKDFNTCVLEHLPCRIAVPRSHLLAKKESLTWNDLSGETFYMIKQGDSPIINSIRKSIKEHTDISIVDVDHFYDTSVFNECEQMGYVMETLDIWNDIHPSLVTIPMNWEYTMPYGIVYSKNPSTVMKNFIEEVQATISSK